MHFLFFAKLIKRNGKQQLINTYLVSYFIVTTVENLHIMVK